MFDRPRMHWLPLGMGIFFLLAAASSAALKVDQFLIYLYVLPSVLLLSVWAGTFYVIADDRVERHKFFITRSIAYVDIVSIEPHTKDEQWSYGRVFVVTDRHGHRFVFQPAKGDEFLRRLEKHTAIQMVGPQVSIVMKRGSGHTTA